MRWSKRAIIELRWAMHVMIGVVLLTAFGATFVLAIRSPYVSDEFRFRPPPIPGLTSRFVISLRADVGGLEVLFSRIALYDGINWVRPFHLNLRQRFDYNRWQPLDQGDRFGTSRSFGPFQFVTGTRQRQDPPGLVVQRRHGIAMPLWCWSILTGLPLVYWMFSMRRRWRWTRVNPTLCKSCGYDLRAGHEKCPECGAESHVKSNVDAPGAAAGDVNATTA